MIGESNPRRMLIQDGAREGLVMGRHAFEIREDSNGEVFGRLARRLPNASPAPTVADVGGELWEFAERRGGDQQCPSTMAQDRTLWSNENRN